jgi:hypothetical protein
MGETERQAVTSFPDMVTAQCGHKAGVERVGQGQGALGREGLERATGHGESLLRKGSA